MTYVPFSKSSAPTSASPIALQAITAGSTLLLTFGAGMRETCYAVTLTQACSISVASGTSDADQTMTIDLVQGNTGGAAVSFSNVSWAGGIAPSFNLAVGKQDTIQLRSVGQDVMGWPVSMGRLPLVPALPGAPAGLVVTSGSAQATISAAAVTAYPAVTGYNVYAGPAAGTESAVPVASNVSLPFTDTSLPAGVARYYKVAAVNSVGIGPFSAEASATPTANGALPGAPPTISVVGGNGFVTVTAGSVSATPSVSGYTIRRGVTAGGESNTPLATNVALPYSDGSVVNGITYYYTVAAVNALGAGAASAEASATPTAPAVVSPAHYGMFSSTDAVFYASPSPAFNPSANPFDMQAHVRMANWASSGYGGTGETCLWGCWDINAANRLWRLGLTATGAVRASWATGSASAPTAVSSVAIGASGNFDLWIRATVTPTTGVVTFFTSVDGASWMQLGTPVTASGSGAVYTPATPPYLVIGSNASGGSSGNTAEQFAGRFYEARLYVNGSIITNPTVGSGGITDSKGFTYSASASVSLV